MNIEIGIPNVYLEQDALIYLACAYTHEDKNVEVARFELANRVAARLMEKGLMVFSPISHTHPIAIVGDLPTTWDFWKKYDTTMLQRSTMLAIIHADGWDRSKGVKGEIEIARQFKLPIKFVTTEGEFMPFNSPSEGQ